MRQVALSSLLRNGSLIVGSLTFFAYLASALSGTVLIHPLVAVVLMIGSVGFFGMSSKL
jgi:hypothetical protein